MKKLFVIALLLLFATVSATPNWNNPYWQLAGYSPAVVGVNYTNYSGQQITVASWWTSLPGTGTSWSYLEFDNGNGTFYNASWTTNFGGSAEQQLTHNVLLNSSIGSVIRWRHWVNSSATVWNATPIMTFNTTNNLVVNALDEENGNQLTYNFTIYNSTNSTTYTNKSASFIINNPPTGSVTVTFVDLAGLYYPRSYSTTILANLLPTALTGYLLRTSQGQVVVFIVQNQAQVALTGATVTAQRQVSGSTTTVVSLTTDSTGAASTFLSPTTAYTLTFTASGYSSAVLNIVPASSVYTIRLGGNFSGIGIPLGQVSYYFSPSGNALNASNQTQQIKFVVQDLNASLIAFALRLYFNGTLIGTANNTGNLTGGEVVLTINNTYFSLLNATNGILTAVGSIYYPGYGEYNVSTLWGLVTYPNIDLSLAAGLKLAGAYPQLQTGLLLFALIILIVIALSLGDLGIISAGIGLVVIGIFMITGLFGATLSWQVYVVGALVVIGIAYLRGSA